MKSPKNNGRPSSIHLTHNGKTLSVSEWAAFINPESTESYETALRRRLAKRNKGQSLSDFQILYGVYASDNNPARAVTQHMERIVKKVFGDFLPAILDQIAADAALFVNSEINKQLSEIGGNITRVIRTGDKEPTNQAEVKSLLESMGIPDNPYTWSYGPVTIPSQEVWNNINTGLTFEEAYAVYLKEVAEDAAKLQPNCR